MKEAKALVGEFLGFKEEQRDAKLHSLMSVISEHAMAGLYAKADFADWQDVMSSRISKDLNTPYVLLAYDLMDEIISCLDLQYGEYSVDFIFDEQMHLSDILQSHWAHFHKGLSVNLKREISRPQHADDKKFPPLQAADLLAWHVRNWYAERIEGKPFSGPCNAALEQFSFFSVDWDRRRMERYYSRLRAGAVKSGSAFLYEHDVIKKKIKAMNKNNRKIIDSARPGDTISLVPLPIPGTSLYLLVRSCPNVGTPHLHTKFSELCCLAGQPPCEMPP